MKTWLLIFTFAFPGFALVGGKPVPAGRFPAVVLIEECTATKIGEYHFLLAAHCVVEAGGEDETYTNQIKSTFSEGIKISFDRAVDHAKNVWSDTAKIARVFVHPAYRYSAVSQPWLKPQAISDVAVVVLAEKTPEIPTLPLAAEPLAAGDAVTKLGYGCPEGTDEKIHAWVTAGNRRLLSAESTVSDGLPALTHYSATAKKSKTELAFYSTDKAREFLLGSFTVTPGKYHRKPPTGERDLGDAAAASLGFSDSGGPLLVKNKGKWAVAGVNAKSLLWPSAEHGTKLVPVALDLHTRLDPQSFSGTSTWLNAVLALTPGKAPGRASLDGLFATVVDPATWKKAKEPTLTKDYLRFETKGYRASLTTATGKPCALGLKKLSLYDLNNEENAVFALAPNEDEDEKALKPAGEGQWKVTADELKVESVLLELDGKKAPPDAPACLFRLE